MADISQFTIGTEADCGDGAVGWVSRVIVDPVAEKATHLVVEPEHRRDSARLVPLDIIDGAAFLIRDAGVPDRNIHILETLDVAGGSLDGANTAYSASISKSLRSTTDSTTPRSA